MIQSSPGGEVKSAVRALNVLFYALFLGIIIFLAICLLITRFIEKTELPNYQFQQILLIIVSVVAAVCLVTAFSGYKKYLAQISAVDRLNLRLEQFRGIFIRFMSLCEGAALFSVIGFFLTGNFWFIAITFIMLVAMISKRPSKQRLANDLQLDSQELQQLD